MLLPAIVLDASASVEDALDRLAVHEAGACVVIRRQIELDLFFYTYRAGPLRDVLREAPGRLGSHPADLDLRTALDLHEHEGVDTAEVSDATGGASARLREFQGVVLDGTTVLGVHEPLPPATGSPPLAPPPPAPPAHPATRPGLLDRMRRGGAETPGRRTRSWRGAGGGSGAEASVEEEATAPEPSVAAPLPADEAADPEPARDVDPSPAAADAPVSFRAHPRLDLERDVVEPGARFDLTIGLSPEAVEGVGGTLVAVDLPAGTRELDLDVQVVADGFRAPAGWRFHLRVPLADPASATLEVPLQAPEERVTRLSVLEVHFAHAGSPCGFAFRRIAVQAPEHARGDAASFGLTTGNAWKDEGPTGGVLIDPGDPAPDLWITISKPDGNQATGRFVWTFHSPHPIALPDAPLPMDLGGDAHTFATRLIRLVREREGTALVKNALESAGRQIRDRAPEELDDVLRAVWNAVHPREGRAPTVLIHSAETQVPWELAILDDPPDPASPPFLGAQVAVGRWILGARGVRVPPPHLRPVDRMAVVVGDYRSSMSLRLLPEAEAEGEELERRYGALRLTATVADLHQLLEGKLGTPPGGTEAIHFACHGEIDPRNPGDAAIYMDDDQRLDPLEFLGAPVGRASEPFLFLNACQVGHGGELLGDFAGFAGNSIRNRFRGFVAPLWNVNDRVAREIALTFYEDAFGNGPGGVPVSEILRRIRGRYRTDGDEAPVSTYLAYVFYGHPSLLLQRS